MHMDLNDIRSLVTLLGFVLFTGLAAWTWRPTRHAAHDAAARLPFEGDAAAQAPTKTHTTATGPGEPS
jgi:cytochrome c oxidase cbb3-type subunit IV